jgi:hypothetical protein
MVCPERSRNQCLLISFFFSKPQCCRFVKKKNEKNPSLATRCFAMRICSNSTFDETSNFAVLACHGRYSVGSRPGDLSINF